MGRRATHISSGVCRVAFAILWLGLLPLAHAANDAAGGSAAAPQTAEAVLELRINGEAHGESFIVLLAADNAVWLERGDYARLRVKAPVATARISAGREYLPLAAIPGVVISLDAASSVVAVSLPAMAFLATTESLQPQEAPQLTRSAAGAFFNYELYGQRGDYAGANTGGAWAEAGLYAPLGVLTSTAVAARVGAEHRAARLETTFTHDNPAAMRTLRLGDGVSVPGSWGRAARFAGVQWGTNFATRPDLVTTPLLSAGGEAVVPSTIDIFVNGQQVGSTEVPAGPFVIDRLPAVTGTGAVRLVVNDALGRTQVVTLPFYSSPALLRPGLRQYSFELGAIRRNFGERSNDYGTLLASATWRAGLMQNLTLELHGEALQDGARAGGAGLAVAIGRLGVVDFSLASGGDGTQSGFLSAAGFEHAGRRFSLSLRSEIASRGFRQIGDSIHVERPRERLLVQAGLSMGRAGSLGLAMVSERHFSGPARRVYSVTHSLDLGRGFLGFNLSQVEGDDHSRSAYLGFTLPLGDARSASLSVRNDTSLPAPDTEVMAELQRSAPPGSGYGYRLSASSAGNYNAGWIQQFEPLAIEAEAARYASMSAQRVSLSGGAVVLGGALRATRAITDSFALVDAGGIEGLTVYVENQPVTRTDKTGHALVRRLRPYERNQVGIDAKELPIDASIGAQSVDVVPAWRSGIVVALPVQRQRGGVFRLVRRDGTAVPPGAVVHFKGADFPVGLDGRTYVTGYDHGLGAEARWEGGHCSFRVEPPPPDDPLPDLGDVLCRTVGE